MHYEASVRLLGGFLASTKDQKEKERKEFLLLVEAEVKVVVEEEEGSSQNFWCLFSEAYED